MPKYEVVYFSGCPLIDRAKSAMREAGIQSYSELNQDRLPSDHPYRKFSSPSIVRDGLLVAGNRNASATCTIVDWNDVIQDLMA